MNPLDRKLAVLTCDDEPILLGSINQLVERAAGNAGIDIELVSAATFEEVTEKLGSIIGDQRLELALVFIGQGFKGSEKTGADFVGDMRARGETAPAIVTTGGTSYEEQRQIKSLESTTFLMQPYKTEDLISIIEGILKNKVSEPVPSL